MNSGDKIGVCPKSKWSSLYPTVYASPRAVPERAEFETEKDMTGGQRVWKFWKSCLGGGTTGEASLWTMCFGTAGAVGLVYGSMFDTRQVMRDFIRKHNEYTFEGQLEARRKLMDYVALKCLSNGIKYAWRFVLFSGGVSLLGLTSVVYRNDIKIRDFGASGAVVGGLWKAKLGLKGAFSGAFFCCMFGLCAGSFLKMCFWIRGVSVPEYRKYLNSTHLDYYEQRHVDDNRWLVKHLEKHKMYKMLIEHQEELEKTKMEPLLTEGYDQKSK